MTDPIISTRTRKSDMILFRHELVVLLMVRACV
jgi:hypothetical protein